jgi:hypothetical protein
LAILNLYDEGAQSLEMMGMTMEKNRKSGVLESTDTGIMHFRQNDKRNADASRLSITTGKFQM